MENQRPLQTFTMDSFQLLRTIGTGTFARVRLAKIIDSGELVVLKIMKKSYIVKKRQVGHINSERRYLAELNSPFTIRLHGSFQDDRRIYLVQEYIPGGELYKLIRRARQLNVRQSQFYTAEIAMALSYLHSRNIVYRDLKPENILLSAAGHVKIIDYGFVKRLQEGEVTYTICGTPEYLPPEVVQQQGHNKSMDWWTLGIILYEMMSGRSPFTDRNPIVIYRKIVNDQVEFPDGFDSDAQDIILRLLDKNPETRAKEQEIFTHSFFANIDWNQVNQLQLQPPYTPLVRSLEEANNFDRYEEEEEDGTESPLVDYYSEFPDF